MANSAQTRTRSTNSAIARGQGREAICRALPRVVARDGFDGVTYRSVAAEAGVTHGLVSYHFKTREAMIHEALKWAVEHTLESAHLAMSTGRLDDFASDVPRALDGLTLQHFLYEEPGRTEQALSALRRLLAPLAATRTRSRPTTVAAAPSRARRAG
jgi:AcrR family transcriptional regulator